MADRRESERPTAGSSPPSALSQWGSWLENCRPEVGRLRPKLGRTCPSASITPGEEFLSVQGEPALLGSGQGQLLTTLNLRLCLFLCVASSQGQSTWHGVFLVLSFSLNPWHQHVLLWDSGKPDTLYSFRSGVSELGAPQEPARDMNFTW